MYKFLKGFGLGLLYALLLPFMIVALAVIAVFYGIPNFVVKLFKVIINFFKGAPIFPPFEEDIKAEEYYANPRPAPAPAPAPQTTTNVYLQTNWYPGMPGGPAAPQQQAPQANQVPPPQPQPNYIDSNATPLANEIKPSELPNQTPPVFGGELLEHKEEDEQ